jgi:hypothetical protein
VTAGGLVADVTDPLGARWLWGCLDRAHLGATKERQEEVLNAAEEALPPLPRAAV